MGIGGLGDITEGLVSGFCFCIAHSLKLKQAGEVENGLINVYTHCNIKRVTITLPAGRGSSILVVLVSIQ